MKKVIRKIDRAIKSLYNLEPEHRAENFLIAQPAAVSAVRATGLEGALYIRGTQPRAISVGIYLSEGVLEGLRGFDKWEPSAWSHRQTSAFSLAAEEVSHFNCLLYHADIGRSVSQLELEMQGEIDKFCLTYFARSAGKVFSPDLFKEIFDQLFFRFRWANGLTPEQRRRYADANALAKKFVLKVEKDFSRNRLDRALNLLRRFYRSNKADKFSFLSG